MKHVFSVLSVTCIAFFTLFLSTTNVSCKKGDTGPKGDTGNANVAYSAWLDVSYDAVTNQAGDTIYYFEASIPAPKITDSILNKGDVRVYINLGTTAAPQILSLPYSDIITPYPRKGAIDLEAYVDASTVTSGGQKTRQYRYVLISGTVPARRDVDLNDYNKVKQLYNIPD
jgi:hypothetical protein